MRDLAVRIVEAADLDGRSPALESHGWLEIAAGPTTHQVRIKQDDAGRRTHIAHFFNHPQWEIAHQRLFAAWLRDHPDDRHRYAALKQELASIGLVGRDYTAAKTGLIQEIVDRACEARGFTRLEVNDKRRR